MSSLFQNTLDDPSQLWAADSSSAQQLAGVQRQFQRLGLLKPSDSAGKLPQVGAGYLDNYKMPGGLAANPFAATPGMRRPPQRPQLPVNMQPPSFPDPSANEQPASDAQGLADLARVNRRGNDTSTADALARAEAVLRGLPQPPDVWNERPTDSPRAMTPLEGPDTGEPNPNATASPPPAAFVQTMMPHALTVAKETGLDPRLVLAQAALETGHGRYAPGNNYFGIKSHGRPDGQTLNTAEVGPNGPYKTSDSFRTYQNPGESARDYVDFLRSNSRYAPVLAAKGLEAQIAAMGKSGYATDPNYTTKLRQLAYSFPEPAAKRGGYFTDLTR